jgi:hypothetical protein
MGNKSTTQRINEIKSWFWNDKQNWQTFSKTNQKSGHEPKWLESEMRKLNTWK